MGLANNRNLAQMAPFVDRLNYGLLIKKCCNIEYALRHNEEMPGSFERPWNSRFEAKYFTGPGKPFPAIYGINLSLA